VTALTLKTATALTDRRALGPWFVAEFLVSYASTLFLTGCYDYAEKGLGATAGQRLWMSAAWGFAYIFIAVLGGRISERFGPRAAAATFCAASLASCLIGLTAIALPRIWMIPLIMLPFNFTGTMIWPAIESGLTRSPGKMPLSRRMAYYNLAWGSAGFLAMFTHGMLESISFSLIFIAAALSCGLAAITLGVWAIPAHMIGAQHVPDTQEGEHEIDDPAVRRRATLLLKMAWITNPLAYMAIYVLIPVMTQLTHVENLALAGMIGSIWFVVRFLGFAVAGHWTGWHYKVRWQLGPLAAMTLSMACMLLIPNLAVLIVGQIVFGFSTAILYSASLYYSMHVSDGHGGHAALHEAAIGAGSMVGPLIGALASTGHSQRPMLPIALGVTGLLAAGFAVIAWMALARPAAAAKNVPVSTEPV
jgi:MFS family permease